MSFLEERFRESRKAIKVYTSVDATNYNTLVLTSVPFPNETLKDSDVYTHSNVTNNSRIYVLVSGYYEIEYKVLLESGDNNPKNIRCAIRINGSTLDNQSISYSYSENLTDGTMSVVCPRYMSNLSAGDYLELVVLRVGSAGSAIILEERSYLNLTLERRN